MALTTFLKILSQNKTKFINSINPTHTHTRMATPVINPTSLVFEIVERGDPASRGTVCEIKHPTPEHHRVIRAAINGVTKQRRWLSGAFRGIPGGWIIPHPPRVVQSAIADAANELGFTNVRIVMRDARPPLPPAVLTKEQLGNGSLAVLALAMTRGEVDLSPEDFMSVVAKCMENHKQQQEKATQCPAIQLNQ